jgi:hypothetical protein
MKNTMQEQLAQLVLEGRIITSPITPASIVQASMPVDAPDSTQQASVNPVHQTPVNHVASTIELQELRQKVDELEQSKDILERQMESNEARNKNLEFQLNDLQKNYFGLPATEEYKLKLNELAASQEESIRLQGHLHQRFIDITADRDALDSRGKELDRQEDEIVNQKWAVAARESRAKTLETSLAKIQKNIGNLQNVALKLASLQDNYNSLNKNFNALAINAKNITNDRDRYSILLRDEITERKQLNVQVTKLKRELKAADNSSVIVSTAESSIRSFETVAWLTSNFEDSAEQVVPKKVLLIGEGPWSMNIFTEHLQSLGFEVWQDGYRGDVEVVIVGRTNWDEQVIDKQIELREDKSLRVYPQELFIFLLAMECDPFVFVPEVDLLKFAQGHSVLEYLINLKFPWPESDFQDAPQAGNNGWGDSGDVSSPLFKLGYTVAQNIGLMKNKRRSILENALSDDDLPWCISQNYMDDWGSKDSRKRLRRIAWHLHFMTLLHRHHAQAVSKWKDDLSWLKSVYYRSMYRFKWPV